MPMWKRILIGNEKSPISIYTFIHFLSGVFFGRIGVSFLLFFILHTAFELWENSEFGVQFFLWLANFFKDIIGVEPWEVFLGDSFLNSFLDTLAALIGFYFGYKWRQRVRHINDFSDH